MKAKKALQSLADKQKTIQLASGLNFHQLCRTLYMAELPPGSVRVLMMSLTEWRRTFIDRLHSLIIHPKRSQAKVSRFKSKMARRAVHSMSLKCHTTTMSLVVKSMLLNKDKIAHVYRDTRVLSQKSRKDLRKYKKGVINCPLRKVLGWTIGFRHTRLTWLPLSSILLTTRISSLVVREMSQGYQIMQLKLGRYFLHHVEWMDTLAPILTKIQPT